MCGKLFTLPGPLLTRTNGKKNSREVPYPSELAGTHEEETVHVPSARSAAWIRTVTPVADDWPARHRFHQTRYVYMHGHACVRAIQVKNYRKKDRFHCNNIVRIIFH